MPRDRKVIHEILSRRDPEGYYVIVAKKGFEKYISGNIRVIHLGDKVIIRTKSRRLAQKILNDGFRKGLIIL